MNSAERYSGVYIYVFEIVEGAPVRVGALGQINLGRGFHAYVGSAKRAIAKRLKRHRRKRKPMRWHIDYLARVARPVCAVTWAWREGRECRLAAAIDSLELGELAAKSFGASDCACPGHLFRLNVSDPRILRDDLSAEIGEAGAVESYEKPAAASR